MTLELSEIWPVHVKKAGSDTVELAAGDKLRVQTWDPVNGIQYILPETAVPAGTRWVASVVVDIQEIDV
jgi:hypothetical protein